MFFITFGQPDHRIDSLVNVIKKEKKDTNTVRAYLLLYNALRLSNADSALKVSQKAFKLSQELDFQYGMACGYSNIGDYYNGKGNYSKALDNALKAITIFERLGTKKSRQLPVILSGIPIWDWEMILKHLSILNLLIRSQNKFPMSI